jgi:hypothetical protein
VTAKFDGPQAGGAAVAYLSPGTAKTLTTTYPTPSGTSQILKVGLRTTIVSTPYATIVLRPDLMPDPGANLSSTNVNQASYSAALSDVCLDVRYTTTGTVSITLPALSTVPDGKVYVVADSAYNASTHNITVNRTGGDLINDAAESYVINISGSVIWFKANTITGNWEVI